VRKIESICVEETITGALQRYCLSTLEYQPDGCHRSPPTYLFSSSGPLMLGERSAPSRCFQYLGISCALSELATALAINVFCATEWRTVEAEFAGGAALNCSWNRSAAMREGQLDGVPDLLDHAAESADVRVVVEPLRAPDGWSLALRSTRSWRTERPPGEIRMRATVGREGMSAM